MDGTVSARDEDEWDTESAQQTIDLQSATGNELVLLQALRTVTGGQRGAETVLAQHGLTLKRPHGLSLSYSLIFIFLSKSFTINEFLPFKYYKNIECLYFQHWYIEQRGMRSATR